MIFRKSPEIDKTFVGFETGSLKNLGIRKYWIRSKLYVHTLNSQITSRSMSNMRNNELNQIYSN